MVQNRDAACVNAKRAFRNPSGVLRVLKIIICNLSMVVQLSNLQVCRPDPASHLS